MGYVGFSVQADAVGTSDRETAGILCSVMGKKLESELACTAGHIDRSFFLSCESLPFAGPSECVRRCGWLPHQFCEGSSQLDLTEALVFIYEMPMQDRFDLDPDRWVMAP